MPRSNRGSKGRPSPIGIEVHVIQVPRGTTREEVLYQIRDSVRNGSYSLPKNWIIQIGWSNNGKAMRFDEFENAMADSTQGGRGWDKLILNLVEKRLRKLKAN